MTIGNGYSYTSFLIVSREPFRAGLRRNDPNLLRHLAMRERPSQIASSLTPREDVIAHLVSRGLRNKEIARELHLSEGTVKMHLHHIYEKLRLTMKPVLLEAGPSGFRR